MSETTNIEDALARVPFGFSVFLARRPEASTFWKMWTCSLTEHGGGTTAKFEAEAEDAVKAINQAVKMATAFKSSAHD